MRNFSIFSFRGLAANQPFCLCLPLSLMLKRTLGLIRPCGEPELCRPGPQAARLIKPALSVCAHTLGQIDRAPLSIAAQRAVFRASGLHTHSQIEVQTMQIDVWMFVSHVETLKSVGYRDVCSILGGMSVSRSDLPAEVEECRRADGDHAAATGNFSFSFIWGMFLCPRGNV